MGWGFFLYDFLCPDYSLPLARSQWFICLQSPSSDYRMTSNLAFLLCPGDEVMSLVDTFPADLLVEGFTAILLKFFLEAW